MTAFNQAGAGSFLYRLDPRTKLLLVLLFTVLVFVLDSLVVAAAQMLVFILLCLLAKISLKKLFPHWKFLLFLMAVVMILQILFGEGPFTGMMICCRIVSITVVLPMLTMTTSARSLSYGITRLGLNYRAAHIITSTLNLIPSFEDETRLIMEARRLRGIRSFEEGSFFSKLKEYNALALPLMIKAMRKAQLVGLAMDARAFGAYKTRTWLIEIKMTATDYLAFASAAACFVIAVTANFLIKR